MIILLSVTAFFTHVKPRRTQDATQRSVLTVTLASPLFHTLVRAFMHFMTDEVGEEKIPKLNIPLTVIGSICSAGTDYGILLPCWSAVYLSSLPPSPPFPIIAIWHSPFHCQSGQHGCSIDLFVPIAHCPPPR